MDLSISPCAKTETLLVRDMREWEIIQMCGTGTECKSPSYE
jgi:hypothetical protein